MNAHGVAVGICFGPSKSPILPPMPLLTCLPMPLRSNSRDIVLIVPERKIDPGNARIGRDRSWQLVKWPDHTAVCESAFSTSPAGTLSAMLTG